MSKIKYEFLIPEAQQQAFSKAYKEVTGNEVHAHGMCPDATGAGAMFVYRISVSKYELLYLRLAVTGGEFIDLEARERAEAKSHQEQLGVE